MRTIQQYVLKDEVRGNNRFVLCRNGELLGAEVEGSVMETQFELDNRNVLIWITDDSPYDEGLHVYLIEENGSVLDALEAGADFSPGILKIINTGDNWVEFEFFTNDRKYRLEVTKTPGLRGLLPTGWKYKRLLSLHQLIVREM